VEWTIPLLGVTAQALFIQALHGLVYGLAYILVAVGLTIVFGLLGVLNLAHGELYMLGAYFGLALISMTNNFWLALVVSPILVGAVGYAWEISLFRRLYGKDHLFTFILTFGLSLFFREIAMALWGGKVRSIPLPLMGSTRILGTDYPDYRLFILFFSVILIIGLWLLLTRSNAGTVIRAAAHNSQMLAALGVNVPRIFTLVFILGAALAAISGVILGPIFFVYPYMGVEVLLPAFVIIILGGMGSFEGAIIAGILIGELIALASLWINPRWAETLPFVVMVLILLIRPQGLLGKRGVFE
jgi:branched-chain amino acid transport system permease protein